MNAALANALEYLKRHFPGATIEFSSAGEARRFQLFDHGECIREVRVSSRLPLPDEQTLIAFFDSLGLARHLRNHGNQPMVIDVADEAVTLTDCAGRIVAQAPNGSPEGLRRGTSQLQRSAPTG